MSRRSILSVSERDSLLVIPENQDDLIRYYTFNESDLSLIRQRRGDANRLGFPYSFVCCAILDMVWPMIW